MEYYIILARSVTYAQRMRQALERSGIRCRIARAPRELSETGCAYTLQVTARDLAGALIAIHRAGLDPVQIFLHQNGGYREVGL